MRDVWNVFDQPLKHDTGTYDDIRKISTGQGDNYTTGYLLGLSYFKENYNVIAIDLTKKQTLDVDPKAM